MDVHIAVWLITFNIY